MLRSIIIVINAHSIYACKAPSSVPSKPNSDASTSKKWPHFSGKLMGCKVHTEMQTQHLLKPSSHQLYDCSFVRFHHGRQALETVKQMADIFAYSSCRSAQNVRQQYDARTIISS